MLLQNEFLSVEIAEKGAELRSVYNRAKSFEYMWSAEPAVWPRVSPVLFPIVGRLKDDHYEHEGKRYRLGQHGFLRDENFIIQRNDATEICMAFASTEKHLEFYPFPFSLEMKYSLQGQELRLQYAVTNLSPETMFFSLGTHPGFAIPNYGADDYSDYYLEFNNDQYLDHHLISGGLISDEVERIDLSQQQLSLSKELFMRDALVMKTLKSDTVSLKCRKHPHGLSLKAANFPFYGIWAQKQADFVCLEPWHGIADGVAATGLLSEKEGIIALGSMEVFTTEITFCFF
jgi:galactose mutarotase-like enzyme